MPGHLISFLLVSRELKLRFMQKLTNWVSGLDFPLIPAEFNQAMRTICAVVVVEGIAVLVTPQCH
jgi:hypothetical protein